MRTFSKLSIMVLVLLSITTCVPTSPTAEPTKPPAPGAPTAAPTKPAAPTSPTAAPAAKIKRGGVVRVAPDNTTSTLDPHQSRIMNRGEYTLLMDSLVRWDRKAQGDEWEVTPDLAESWEVVDPKTIVMTLRKGVKFHDGSTWNSTVAKWNLERMANLKTSTVKEHVYNIASVGIVDDYKIRLNLNAPSVVTLPLLTPASARGLVQMVSKEAVEKYGDEEFNKRGVGSGPMQLESWTPDLKLLLKKWDGYWRQGTDGKPLPYIDGFELRGLRDPAVAMVELKAGTIDVIPGRLEAKDIITLKSDPNLAYESLPWMGVTMAYGMNVKSGPYANNVKLRQALWYGIDRDAMVTALSLGLGRPDYYFWTKGQPGYDESLPRYDYQPAKAKQLMQEAGYSSSLDLRLMTGTAPRQLRDAEVLQQMWGPLGVRVTIEQMESAAIQARWDSGNYDMGNWDILPSADPAMLSARLTARGSINRTAYSNPKLDKCLEEGETTYDVQKRVAIYKECQKIVFEDAPIGLTWFMPEAYAYRKGVVNGIRIQWRYYDYVQAWLNR